VSHLGDNLSALVDGELTGTDLDRANAHLAACERCRGDAAALRALKSQLRGLGGGAGHAELTSKLLAVAGQPPEYLDVAADTRLSPGRRRYFVWGALSLAVVGGVGAAAFGMGGGQPGTRPGPDVVPQTEMFSVQHATTSGDVPFPEPSRSEGSAVRPHQSAARVPVRRP